MKSRLAGRILGGFAVAGSVLVGTAVMTPTVAAADDVPRWGLYGDNIHTVGDRNFCRGDVNVRLESLPGSPGHVLAHVTPLGFEGGPCGTWVHINYYSLALPIYHDDTVYVSAGTGPGQTVTVDLPTGSGANQIAASTWPNANWGVSWYVLVP